MDGVFYLCKFCSVVKSAVLKVSHPRCVVKNKYVKKILFLL